MIPDGPGRPAAQPQTIAPVAGPRLAQRELTRPCCPQPLGWGAMVSPAGSLAGLLQSAVRTLRGMPAP